MAVSRLNAEKIKNSLMHEIDELEIALGNKEYREEYMECFDIMYMRDMLRTAIHLIWDLERQLEDAKRDPAA